MALTQMQLIQSLGEAMAWFERELQWGVPATELRHLSGRIGELYAALISNGQMATEVNQDGYDVVSVQGERISVKTTAVMTSSGSVFFNSSTLEKVDRIIILRINTEEMQIEILLDNLTDEARQLMSPQNSSGKVGIALSKLTRPVKESSNIPILKSAKYDHYLIKELENGSIEIDADGENIYPVKPVLREIASKLNISWHNSNGNLQNTRQLGSIIINNLTSRS